MLEQWDFSTAGDLAFQKSLHPFEVAAIANLMTTSSDRDEACKWYHTYMHTKPGAPIIIVIIPDHHDLSLSTQVR